MCLLSDPCLDGYTVIDDVTRDVSYYTLGYTNCDNHLVEGWYRFLLNGNNAIIPTSCVPVSLLLLLLLRSKLYLWGSPFWVRFSRICPFFLFFVFFFSPAIEVVILRLRGWCILGEFLLPAFTRLGHGCQDLLSPHCNGMLGCMD